MVSAYQKTTEGAITMAQTGNPLHHEYNMAGDDEPTMSFAPLNSSLSYYVSQQPPSLEVVPTEDAAKFNKSSPGGLVSRSRSQHGTPMSDSINTRHVSGRKIDQNHAQYALSAGMMLGVRECVGGGEAADDEDKIRVVEEDFARVEKYQFPAGSYFINSKMSSLHCRYKFKAYAPKIFAEIRGMAGVDKQLFLHSICGDDAFIEFVSNAKSGQFFFYSHDGRYMIKTQTKEEKTFLRQILPHYYRHMEGNPHSFLTHFYGMYRVEMPDLGQSVYFVIMKSVFNTEEEIHKIWDLKGSTKGRRSDRGDTVHKDLDILDEGRKLQVGPIVKEGIMEQLKKDSLFLAKMEIMDYSLLIGVHLCLGEGTSGSIPKTGSSNTLAEDAISRRRDFKRSNTPYRREMRNSVMVNGSDVVIDDVDPLSMDAQEDERRNESFDDESDSESVFTKDDSDTADFEYDLSSVFSSSFSPGRIGIMTPNPYSSREDLGIESFHGGNPNSNLEEIYFCGIIDILQRYNTRKWGETMMRKAAGNQVSSISCVDPVTYANRFVDFMSDLIE